MHRKKEVIMKYVFMLCAAISIVAVGMICYFLFYNGIPVMGKIGFFKFLSGTEWRPSNEVFGILPMIIGSIYVTVGAIIIGVPIGILTAVFLSSFCNKRIYKFIKPAVNLLAGIPSVVFGFFGLMVIVPFIRNYIGGTGSGILSASLVLGIMILPTIIGVSESAINSVSKSYYEGALALGATHERSIFKVIVPSAKSGIFAGVILGIGRAIGETMAVIMVAGNQAVIPDSILSGVRTMTANIVLEMGYAQDLHREALVATAVVLFVFILIINLCFNCLKGRITNEEK